MRRGGKEEKEKNPEGGKKKMRKPIAFKISSLRGGEILYKCPVCDTSFAGLGRKELYCHNCGEKIDWSGVRERVQTFLFGNRKSEEELCAKVNELNRGFKAEEPKEGLVEVCAKPEKDEESGDEQEEVLEVDEPLDFDIMPDEKTVTEPEPEPAQLNPEPAQHEDEPAQPEEEEKKENEQSAEELEIDSFALEDDHK